MDFMAEHPNVSTKSPPTVNSLPIHSQYNRGKSSDSEEDSTSSSSKKFAVLSMWRLSIMCSLSASTDESDKGVFN